MNAGDVFRLGGVADIHTWAVISDPILDPERVRPDIRFARRFLYRSFPQARELSASHVVVTRIGAFR